MAAPEGNEFWKQRSSHGPKQLFDAPDLLLEACREYFQWTEDNPLYEDKIGFYEGGAVHTEAAKMRAMTIGGLCLYLGITQKTWCEWRLAREDLSEVIRFADEVIKTQKFQGAAAGLLNANIIARDLGLSDKTDLQHLNADGKPTNPPGGSTVAIDGFLAEIAAAIKKETGK